MKSRVPDWFLCKMITKTGSSVGLVFLQALQLPLLKIFLDEPTEVVYVEMICGSRESFPFSANTAVECKSQEYETFPCTQKTQPSMLVLALNKKKWFVQ
jgi:hypothetical protein